MRRLVAALIAAALALTLTGCGGGGGSSSSSSAETPAAPAAPAAAGAAATTGGSTIDNRSANASSTFTAFPTGDFVPADLKSRIDAKQPTLIYFYDSKQNTSRENRKIIDAVRNNNRGLVDLVAYDIGKYVITGSDGQITIDPAFAANRTAVQAVQLARNLGVSFTPFIVLTDAQGYIIWQHRGLADKDFLEREVLRASR